MAFDLVIFWIVVLIISAIIHEVSHGYMAHYLGDPTAKSLGRLSLNPIKHIDPLGSVIVPLVLWLTTQGIFVFGWAKPVPFNPYNLRDQKHGSAKVAAAGPLANLSIAVIFGIVLRFLPLDNGILARLGTFLSIVVIVNLLLGLFNLLPISPLDGSKILFSFLPAKMWKIQRRLEQYGTLILLMFLMLLMLFSPYILVIIGSIYKLLVGHFNFL